MVGTNEDISAFPL